MAELQAPDIHEAWTHKPHDAVSTGNHTVHLITLYILGCTRVQTWMLSMTRISAFRCARTTYVDYIHGDARAPLCWRARFKLASVPTSERQEWRHAHTSLGVLRL